MHSVAIVSVDYAFMTRTGHIVSEGDAAWDDDGALKMFIVKDSLSRVVLPMLYPRR